MDWIGKLLDVGLGGLPSALVSLIPEDTKRRARAHLEAHNPFSQISVNHDLLRATRLAWIEAAEKIIGEAREQAKQPEWKRDAADIISVSGLGISEIAVARDIALDRLRDPGTSPIDRHIEAVIRGVPEFVSPGNDRLLEVGVSGAFVAVLAELCGWPQEEMPPIFERLAHEGLPVRGGKSRAFGELMFAAFAELIKNPQRYPEAKAAFSMVQIHQVLDATEAIKAVADSVFAALGALDGKLEAAIGRRDAGGMLREGADAYLELLPEIAESVARIDETTQRTEEKVDAQTAMLQELLARSAPGLPLATAKAILAAFGEEKLPETEGAIERILRAKAEEFTALKVRLQDMNNSGDAILRELLRGAEILVEQGDFDGAENKLIVAEEHADRARARIRANRGDLAKLRLRYEEAAAHFAKAADSVPDLETDQRLDYLIQSAESLFSQGDEFGDNGALRAAILLYSQTISPLAQRASRPLDWAAAQNNLGNALSKLGERESDTERLEQAVHAYRAALEERPRDRVPLDWAMTQNNLGNTLLTLGGRESDTERLEQAVQAYRAALQEYTRDGTPLDWATAQNNLGNTLLTLGEREGGTERLEQAVQAYRAALDARPRDRVSLGWAGTQNNLGAALSTLGKRESGTEWLEQAIETYRTALEELTRDRVPLDWAMTQNNLGNALLTLGERESGTERLEQAVEAYRAALEERTRDRVPLEWATTQNNLGNALMAQGERESGTESFDQAVRAYGAALEQFTRHRTPLHWAMTQNNLGNAFLTLGGRQSGTEWLEQAVEAYRAALEERTRDRVPLDWAGTQNNLGNALQTLGERESGTERFDEAVEAYRAALHEYTRDRVPLDWAGTQNNLGNALQTLGERGSGTERLEEAVEAYRAALEERTRDRVPLRWAMTQNNLGNALLILGRRGSGTEQLEQAVEAYRAALEERTRDRTPMQWAMTQYNLGNALSVLGERETNAGRLDQAVQAYRMALTEFTHERAPRDWAITQNSLGNVLLTLGERESSAEWLEQAAVAYQEALEERTRGRAPLDWAGTQFNLALVHVGLFNETERNDYVDVARDNFSAARVVYLEEKMQDMIDTIDDMVAQIDAWMSPSS